MPNWNISSEKRGTPRRAFLAGIIHRVHTVEDLKRWETMRHENFAVEVVKLPCVTALVVCRQQHKVDVDWFICLLGVNSCE